MADAILGLVKIVATRSTMLVGGFACVAENFLKGNFVRFGLGGPEHRTLSSIGDHLSFCPKCFAKLEPPVDKKLKTATRRIYRNDADKSWQDLYKWYKKALDFLNQRYPV